MKRTRILLVVAVACTVFVPGCSSKELSMFNSALTSVNGGSVQGSCSYEDESFGTMKDGSISMSGQMICDNIYFTISNSSESTYTCEIEQGDCSKTVTLQPYSRKTDISFNAHSCDAGYGFSCKRVN